jgi:hypothetical protein
VAVDVESSFQERWATKSTLDELLTNERVVCGHQTNYDPPYAIIRKVSSSLGVKTADRRRDDVTLDVEVVANDKPTAAAIASKMRTKQPEGFDLDRFDGYAGNQELIIEFLAETNERDDETGQWHYFVTFLVRENVR